MANWERYYASTEVKGFGIHAPYYEYLLECFCGELEAHLDPHEVIQVGLGGIDPTVTSPEEFIAICRKVIKTHAFSPHIIDQNHQALESLAGVFQTVLSQLEALPPSLPPLHLLVCDYTLDFMTDQQITKLNQTLPHHLHPLGLLMVATDNEAFPTIGSFASRFFRGVNIYPRSPEKLIGLLPNFKPVFITHNDGACFQSYILTLAHKDSPIPEHKGAAHGLMYDEGHFPDWCQEHGYHIT